MARFPISRRSVLGGLAAAGATTAFGAPAITIAAPPKEKVPVVVGAEHGLVYFPWDLAKSLGYFDAEGLDVDLTYVKGGSEAAAALASGQCDYSGNAIDHAIAAAEHGKSLVMVADFMNQPGISLVVRPGDRDKYKTFADFKGKTIGITSIGSATNVLAIWMAHRSGLSKDDVKIVGVGAGSTMIAALSGNQVDVAYGVDPYVTTLIKAGRGVQWLGMFTSGDTRRALGFGQYCFTGALTRGDVLEKHGDRTQKVVNALVRAQKFMATHTSAQIAAVLSDEMRGGTPAGDWAASYSHSRPAYTQHGEMALEGVRAVIETNNYFLAKQSTVDPNEAVRQQLRRAGGEVGQGLTGCAAECVTPRWSALFGLRFWMWPLSVPAVGSMIALINAGLRDASDSLTAAWSERVSSQ